jgi:hypothetical protein
MPCELLNQPGSNRILQVRPVSLLREMEQRFGALPWFLRRAGSSLFGMPNMSPRDLFWVGHAPEPQHSSFTGVHILIVDRRQKRPRAYLSSPIWAQPIYVLQTRGGGYRWGFCRRENGMLTLYSPVQRTKSVRLRNYVDAEVVGRVVGVIRKPT